MRMASLAIVCVLFACTKSTKVDDNSSTDKEPDDEGEAGHGGGGGVGGVAGAAAIVGGASGGAGGAGGNVGGSGGAAAKDAGTDVAAIRNPFVYVSGYDSEIRIFLLDMNSGALLPRGTANGGNNPSYLAWTPERKYLYAGNERTPGLVTAFSINGATGALTRINEASSGGNGPAHIFVHNGGKHVFASNYGSGHVAVLPIQMNGGVGSATDTRMPVPQHAHQIVADIAGKFVFVPATGSNLVAQFSFDAGVGKLAPVNPATVPGAIVNGVNQSPRHIAFHPNQKHAYVVNERGMSVTAFSYNAMEGRLTAIETVSAVPAPVAGGSGAHIIVHPSGGFVYASMRGHNSIAIFAVDATSGKITRVENETGGGTIKTPRNFSLDPTGEFLIVANQDDASVLVFRTNGNNGKLTRVGNPVPTAKGPSFVGVIPLP